jgi:LmbE family N-acetylglucosaminyl deacetylase
MLESFRNRRILVIVAHPDDEVLGAGATLHRLVSELEATVRVVVLGRGAAARDAGNTALAQSANERDAEAARLRLGYQTLAFHDLPDNRFDSVPLLDIVKIVEKEKLAFAPEVVLTHHEGDVNVDHQLTCRAVVTATRPLEGECVHTLLSFETPSSTEWQAANHPLPFRPNVFLEVSGEDLQAKLEAMECYALERRALPHPRSPRSLEALAAWRGSTIGCAFAEAFMLLRSIW